MIFDCKFWAVVRVDIAHDPNGLVVERDTIAQLQGLWDTRDAAESWRAAQVPVNGSPIFMGKLYSYETQAYVLVSCADLKVQFLSDVENKTEEAAKLQVLGITTAVSQKTV